MARTHWTACLDRRRGVPACASVADGNTAPAGTPAVQASARALFGAR
jgi:hypothetical protein